MVGENCIIASVPQGTTQVAWTRGVCLAGLKPQDIPQDSVDNYGCVQEEGVKTLESGDVGLGSGSGYDSGQLPSPLWTSIS